MRGPRTAALGCCLPKAGSPACARNRQSSETPGSRLVPASQTGRYKQAPHEPGSRRLGAQDRSAGHPQIRASLAAATAPGPRPGRAPTRGETTCPPGARRPESPVREKKEAESGTAGKSHFRPAGGTAAAGVHRPRKGASRPAPAPARTSKVSSARRPTPNRRLLQRRRAFSLLPTPLPPPDQRCNCPAPRPRLPLRPLEPPPTSRLGHAPLSRGPAPPRVGGGGRAAEEAESSGSRPHVEAALPAPPRT